MKKTVVLVWVFLFLYGVAGGQLSRDYYGKTCPAVERIVKNVVAHKLKESPNTAAGALRLFFHDCFVEGCDASVLIASTEANVAERDADINLSLPGDGFDVFYRAKRALESQCPNTVSCADVMAIATRDLVAMVGGPYWDVTKGRKDGLISKASRVHGNLPTVNMNMDELISLFKSKSLSTGDMVTLSGGHTIGFAHCNQFMSRIYNFSKGKEIDPSMDPRCAQMLRGQCPKDNLNPGVVAVNDPTTPNIFDNAYYANAKRGYALLATDQILASDPRTRLFVNVFAKSKGRFFDSFSASMIRLSLVGIKTGNQGEVRRDCGAFNTPP